MPGLNMTNPYTGINYHDRVLTAPIAIIRLSGGAYTGTGGIGKLQNIQFTENIGRQEVRELGNLYTVELPPINISCSFTAAAAMIDFSRLGSTPNSFWPMTDSVQEFANSLLFGSIEVDLEIYTLKPSASRKDMYSHTIIEATDLQSLGVAFGAVLESRSFNIANDQIAATNISGRYLKPIRATNLN